MQANDEENIVMHMNRCEYSISSENDCQCRNAANYKCAHCPFSFCLQHGLQHQQNLKEEIHSLLAKAEVHCCHMMEKKPFFFYVLFNY
jgi:hypothetical protein